MCYKCVKLRQHEIETPLSPFPKHHQQHTILNFWLRGRNQSALVVMASIKIIMIKRCDLKASAFLLWLP